jgi:hypothetical protein
MSTYTQILLHIVFGTKRRELSIPDAVLPRLHAFIGGVVRDEKGVALAIGGMPDHVTSSCIGAQTTPLPISSAT